MVKFLLPTPLHTATRAVMILRPSSSFPFPNRPDRSFPVVFPHGPRGFYVKVPGAGAPGISARLQGTFLFPPSAGRKSRDIRPRRGRWRASEQWHQLESAPPAAGLSALAMEDSGPRIRRRVSVRKRNRNSIESLCVAPAPVDVQPPEDLEDEGAAGSRRRKTGSPGPAQVQPR